MIVKKAQTPFATWTNFECFHFLQNNLFRDHTFIYWPWLEGLWINFFDQIEVLIQIILSILTSLKVICNSFTKYVIYLINSPKINIKRHWYLSQKIKLTAFSLQQNLLLLHTPAKNNPYRFQVQLNYVKHPFPRYFSLQNKKISLEIL